MLSQFPALSPICARFVVRIRTYTLTNSESVGEMTLSTGDYILVWGTPDPQEGYFDAELLDGRRGLVPASFVQRLVGKYTHTDKYSNSYSTSIHCVHMSIIT